MSIEKDKKTELIKSFGSNEQDSGSPNVQIAILSERIKNRRVDVQVQFNIMVSGHEYPSHLAFINPSTVHH